MVYLPHLDYDLQRFGTDRPQRTRQSARSIDAVCRPPDRDAARTRAPRSSSLSEYGLVRREPARAHQPRAARGGAGSRCATSSGPTRSTRAPAGPSPSPITRSPTSTCATPRTCPRCRRCSPACPASTEVLDASELRALRARSRTLRASWSRLPQPMPGSPTTTGSTTRARPTTPARSTSTASRATTRRSSSSIRRSRCRRCAWRRRWRGRRWDSAI